MFSPQSRLRHAVADTFAKSHAGRMGKKSGGCAGLCHLPVAGVCDYSADGWRGLAPDYGCSKFEHRGINADGRCLWLLS